MVANKMDELHFLRQLSSCWYSEIFKLKFRPDKFMCDSFFLQEWIMENVINEFQDDYVIDVNDEKEGSV